MDLQLSGKTAWVTGASGGIGSVIARQLVSEGANVGIHFRSNESSALELVNELGRSKSIAVGGDLSDEGQVDSCFERLSEKSGRVDILIANAGVWPPENVPIHEMTVSQWESTMNNNLKSVFLCSRRFIQHAIAQGIDDPAIVMIGSTAGLFGEAGHGDYAASKAALISGLNLTLKNELARVAPRGRVNVVNPGWVVTPMAKKFTADGASIKQALSTIAMRKVASPEDIAHSVLFLASSHVSGHITGQSLTVSGGMEGRKLYDEDELDLDWAIP